jgi:uncharacterized membrane protein YidH (DUF202 family)
MIPFVADRGETGTEDFMRTDTSNEPEASGKAGAARLMLTWLATSISLIAMAVILVMIVEWAVLPYWPKLALVG